MSEHLTQIEIYEVAAGEPVAPSVTSHSVSCAECAAEVSATRRIIALVEGLEPAAGAGADLDRREGRARSLRRLAGVAAAVVCFAAGVVSQAVWSAANSPVGHETPETLILQHLAVQQAGTDYVAAIAMMVDDSGRLSTEELRMGREVALAAMSGAAFELRQLDGADAVVNELYEAVARVRDGVDAGMGP